MTKNEILEYFGFKATDWQVEYINKYCKSIEEIERYIVRLENLKV